jgi:small-conductance mechanosensitive channel
MLQPSLPFRPFRIAGIRLVAALLLIAEFCGASPAKAQTAGPIKTLLGVKDQKPAAPATTPAPPPPVTPSSQPILLPDVAARSEELKRMLRGASDQLPTAEQISAAKVSIDETDQQLQSRQKETDALLAGTPTALELREEESYWRTKQLESETTRRQLRDWANADQSAIVQSQVQQPQWSATLEENKHTPDLGPALDVIKQSVETLQKLATQAQDQLRIIVNLQVRAANQDQLALDVLDRLGKAREYQDSRLFDRDSLPLWQRSARRQEGENSRINIAASARLLGIRAFASQAKGALGFLSLLLLLSLLSAYRMSVVKRGQQPEDADDALVLHLARHWIALGLLPPLLFGYLLAPLAPLPLIGLVILVSFIPILILLPPFIAPRFRMLLFCLAGVYAASAFVAWMSFSPATKREVQFAIQVAVFGVFALLVRPSRISRLPDEGRPTRLRLLIIRLAVFILGLSLAANLFGYVRLAQFLVILCLYSTFIAISMLAGVRIFTLLLLHGLDRPAAQQFAAVRSYRDGIARWAPRALQWSGLLIWVIVTINLLGLTEWVAARIKDLLDFHIAGAGTSITLGGVLGFFLILLIGYGISSGVRFLLREELLCRFHLARGLPELISSMLHYLLLLLVFFFAVNAGGVELNKFTVLTGALGVGVGFGLQNIVNNFISGLILQFERPIHVGDVLEVDGTTGKVTRIGIRSSTVRTFQGAEVIIPNGNFISGKVINWTLSESLRRVELPVGVAYGTNADQVCKLLDQAARAHESVLTTPEPAVIFKEFGDSSLNFEVQFWVMQESNTIKVKSEVALAVMQLLDDAGIEIPFPQRDLRLRSVDATAAATLLSPNGSGPLTTDNGSQSEDSVVARRQGKGFTTGTG